MRKNTPLSKWGAPEQTPTVRQFHDRIRALVARRTAQRAETPWAALATTHTLDLLSAEDCIAIEQDLLSSGYRFDASATVSQREAPEKYKAPPPATVTAAQAAAEASEASAASGRTEIGQGDNLVQAKANLVGVARMVSTIDQVIELLTHGVPPDTVAVIDDSGGTLTAPVLEGFKAVLCKGGTVRSHLGILTREYGIPCFMNCRLGTDLKDGDRVELELTAPAALTEVEDAGRSVRARVWKLTGGAA